MSFQYSVFASDKFYSHIDLKTNIFYDLLSLINFNFFICY